MTEFSTRIYLAGTLYSSDSLDAYWKPKFAGSLSEDMYTLYDPNPINGSGEEVVAVDKKIIESCDFLVAYVKKASFGTAMGIIHAFNQQNITVFLIDPDNNAQTNPWLSYHSHGIFDSVQKCADMVNILTCKMKVQKI
jgi:nucleoside 2-deoxyribosyltransferase